jgi:hypothetical protein
MRRSLLTIGLIVLATLCAAGQSDRYSLRPNFSGVWVPVHPSADDIRNLVWTITHTGIDVKIKKTFDYKGEAKANHFTLYTDYRHEADLNAVLDRNAPTKVVTVTELKKTKAARSAEMQLREGEVKIYWVATFALSADGTKLTITITEYRKSGTFEPEIVSSEEEVLVRKV